MMKRFFFFLAALFLTAAFLIFRPEFLSRAEETKVVLDRPFSVERLANGNTLIADGGGRDWMAEGSEIIEVNPQGEIVWHFQDELAFAHTAKILNNGNLLIVDTTNNRLLEVTREKEIIWSSWEWPGKRMSDGNRLSYPNDVEELDNGHFLVTDRNNNRLIEIDRSGEVYWQKWGFDHPHNADRLADGHILVSDSEHNQVLELDRHDQPVWSYGGEGQEPLYWPRDVDRLENGRYLITDSRHHRIVEVTSEGKEVWEYKQDLSFPYEADRLTNGNTLISDSSHFRVIEVSPEGKIVWQFRNTPEVEYDDDFRGGFEKDRDGDGWPDGWLRGDLLAEGRGSFIWDENTFHDGRRSARIDNNSQGMAFWHRYYRVRPGKKYDLIGLIKSQDVENYARFEVIFLDKLGGQIGLTARTPDHKGTKNWERYETIFTPPEGAVAADIWCLVEGPGTAWFDDLSLKPVGWQKVLGMKLSLGVLAGAVVVALVLNKLVR